MLNLPRMKRVFEKPPGFDAAPGGATQPQAERGREERELTSVRGGGTETITASVVNSHSHSFTIMKWY